MFSKHRPAGQVLMLSIHTWCKLAVRLMVSVYIVSLDPEEDFTKTQIQFYIIVEQCDTCSKSIE